MALFGALLLVLLTKADPLGALCVVGILILICLVSVAWLERKREQRIKRAATKVWLRYLLDKPTREQRIKRIAARINRRSLEEQDRFR